MQQATHNQLNIVKKTSGWMSPAVPELTSNKTSLSSGPVTFEQLSWLGGIQYIGGIIGSISFGYFSTLFGSKRTTHFLAIPFICAWVMIFVGNHYYYILIARLVNSCIVIYRNNFRNSFGLFSSIQQKISGWASGGALSVVILYVSEIANDE